MSINERQQRRRRIMDKGSDRFALITGQIKNLDESASPRTCDAHHSHSESSPPVMASPEFLQTIEGGTLQDEKMAASSKMVKMRTITTAMNYTHENEIPKIVENASEDTTPATNSLTKLEPVTKKLEPSLSSNNDKHLKFFSSKRISQNITCSERTRAICSLVIALLVIGANSDSSIVSKPFYIIVLTDITIVVARSFCDTKIYSDEVEDERTDDAFKLLERGLMLYHAICGLFIDCSIYLVVVISGLSIF